MNDFTKVNEKFNLTKLNEKDYRDAETEPYVLQKSHIEDDKLIFKNSNGFSQAIKDGFFLVKIPESFNIEVLDFFANNFYLDKENDDIELNRFRGFRKYKSDCLRQW